MIQLFRGGKFEQRERLNQIVREVNRLSAMQGDEFIAVDNSPTGKTLKLKLNQLMPRLNKQGTGFRKGYATTDAGSGNKIFCHLDTDESNDRVEVTCEIAGGDDLNNAIPRLEDGTLITIFKDNDDNIWRSVMTFQATGGC